ncbi:MAG: hypothetical protein AB7O93_12150 [Vicinamibacterales bacterium]
MDRPSLVAAWVLLGVILAGAWEVVSTRAGAGDGGPSARRLPVVRREADPFARWTVTEQFAAQHVIVLQVETRRLDEAPAIARRITEPLQSGYSEVLIYFHRPGRPDGLPPRRVQWTPAAGYVETNYEGPK